jgi:hypothetical protein
MQKLLDVLFFKAAKRWRELQPVFIVYLIVAGQRGNKSNNQSINQTKPI